MTDPRWLSRTVLLLLHAEGLAEHGGLAGLRDEGMLDSALNRAANRFSFGGEADLCALAAAYAFGIARNRPFAHGNKRAAFLAAATFLEINGLILDAAEGEAIAAMLDLAAGDLPEEGFAAWLRDSTRPRGG